MKCYKLSAKVLTFMRQHKALREDLCALLGVKSNALDYHLAENKVDGKLTTLSALTVISKYYNRDIAELVEKCEPETIPA